MSASANVNVIDSIRDIKDRKKKKEYRYTRCAVCDKINISVRRIYYCSNCGASREWLIDIQDKISS